ncbi:general stress protein [Bacillus sp. T33-2]|uniref:general stress protein n=1 Tax=Bacillus sp. T33-2 TaxID=2054168 RepID=UPI0015E0B394|nr:general stress protein [Bacillus sp. T33-2]
MDKKILGVYNSQTEVTSAIEQLRNDGYDVQDLSIIAKTERDHSRVEGQTGATVETFDTTGSRDGGGLAGATSSLMGTVYEKLRGLGLSDEEAKEYVGDVNAGKIILYSNHAPGEIGGGYIESTGYNQKNGEIDQARLERDNY